jgi:hypothetical protein
MRRLRLTEIGIMMIWGVLEHDMAVWWLHGGYGF